MYGQTGAGKTYTMLGAGGLKPPPIAMPVGGQRPIGVVQYSDSESNSPLKGAAYNSHWKGNAVGVINNANPPSHGGSRIVSTKSMLFIYNNSRRWTKVLSLF
jgi:hypothetical protein